MSGFGLLFPAALWLFALLVGISFGLSRAERRRAKAIEALGVRATESRWRIVLPLIVLATIALGLMRPYLGFKEFTVQGVGDDLVLVVDISRSMLARDASPTRLGVAKRKVTDVIDALEKKGRGDRVGIVLFAGESYFFLPLTADYGVARVFAGAIGPELILSSGSALGSALELIAKSFDSTKAQTPRVLLFSDGEELKLDPTAATGALKHRRITVDVIGIGTVAGHPIDVGKGVLLKDAAGAIVVSRLDEKNLRNIAESTGGTYTHATVADDDVRAIIDRSDGAGKGLQSTTTTVRTYNEWGPFFGALALIALGAPFAARLRGNAVVAAIVVLVGSQSGEATAAPRTPFDGAQRYTRGDFTGAAEAFESLTKKNPDRWDLHQALGSARYKNKDYPGALGAYSDALTRAKNGRERFESLFGSGNAKVMSGKFNEAINDYDRALQIKPNDEDVIFNRSIAEKLLEEQQQQQQQQPNEEQADPENEGSGEEGESQKAPSPNGEGKESEPNQPDGTEETEDGGAKDSGGDLPPTPSSKGDRGGEEEGAETPSPADKSDITETPETPDRAAERSGASLDRSEEGTGGDGEISPAADPARLREEEAKSWLESLDEAPVLLQRRDRRRRERGGQTW